jgi:transcriptional regulator with XRE-family HTH domain
MLRPLHSPRYQRLRMLLRAKRKAANVSQSELARRLNVRQAFISKVERGERRLDLVEFLDVAKALEFDPAEAIGELLQSPPERQQARDASNPTRRSAKKR